jgi:hypothetical protein
MGKPTDAVRHTLITTDKACCSPRQPSPRPLRVSLETGRAATRVELELHVVLSTLGLSLLLATGQPSGTMQTSAAQSPPGTTAAGQDVIALSRQKWQWMAERRVDALADLFHEHAVFVHMGGSMSRSQELDVIKSGSIQYKNADIQDISVRVIDSTAVVLSRLRLVAVVGGNEVVNPFVVTEVYVRQGTRWKLASLSFTRLLG